MFVVILLFDFIVNLEKRKCRRGSSSSSSTDYCYCYN